jgi:hypothetical protein
MDGFYANLWDKSQMAEARRNWTESEIAEAIDLYLRTPFGRIHSRNPKIVELAQRLNRTPGSIALKLTNLASIDESLDRKGMSNYSKLDKAVWDRFWGALSAEAARLPQSFEHDRIASVAEPAQARYEVDDSRDYVGRVVPRIVNTRQGQQYLPCPLVPGGRLFAAFVLRPSPGPFPRASSLMRASRSAWACRSAQPWTRLLALPMAAFNFGLLRIGVR